MTNKNENNIKMLTLNNGMEVICSVTDTQDEWYTIQNPVACSHDTETNRLNMSPLFRFGARDTDILMSTKRIDVVYSPTDGLTEEYIDVFVNPKSETLSEATPDGHAHDAEDTKKTTKKKTTKKKTTKKEKVEV